MPLLHDNDYTDFILEARVQQQLDRLGALGIVTFLLTIVGCLT